LDLIRLQDYIAQDNPRAAYRMVQVIQKQTKQLLAHPYSGRPGRVSGTRELVISDTPYLVAYRLQGEWLDVLAVLHSSRRWPEDFE
jgi:addiction module RelE/StbE family toxin